MKRLLIHESKFEGEVAAYTLALTLICFGVLKFLNVFDFNSVAGALCIFYGGCIAVASFFKVRAIVVNEETLEFISRYNTKIINIKELAEVKPFQAGKLRFISYSNIVTVSRSFTGMAGLIVMLKNSNPEVLITGI